MNGLDYDLIIAGGGLAGTLAAYRLRQRRPAARVLLLEEGARLGGNHTWSFHDTDIDPEARAWIAPFVACRWPQQQVRFPKYTRMLALGYNTVFAEGLHRTALSVLGESVRLGAPVRSVEPHRVELVNGEEMRAACVVDARGLSRVDGLTLAYQKFVGLEVRFDRPHGQPYPIIMDATPTQRDGYRFVYTLPYADDRMLIEDTYYSDSRDLDVPALQENCEEYARARGWSIAEILRLEKGVLPVVLGGSAEAILAQTPSGVPAIGLRGGFFHHTTSYSLPFAAGTAELIGSVNPLTSETLAPLTQDWAHRHWRRQRFFRLLNRMLFWAAKPSERYRVLERFYELGEPLIGRFYSASLTQSDKARILLGRPPVPVHRALRVVAETKANPIATSGLGV
jgi:lycopene beta-cyclase